MTEAAIQIVEDEALIAADIAASLEEMGYKVCSIATSGEEAIQMAEKSRPDLVLMDIVLRGEMDGIKAAEQIRGRLRIPVIFLTSYGGNHLLDRAKITEPFGYLLKPYNHHDLHSTIEMALYKANVDKELRQSEERYRALFEQAADSIILIDPEDGSLLEFNDAAHESLGYTREEFRKLTMEDIEATDRGEETVEHYRRITGGASDTFETRHRRKNGEIRDVMVSVRAIHIDDKKYVQTIVRDITDRKHVEKTIRQAKQIWERTFDAVPDLIAILDNEYRMSRVNRAMAEKLGTTVQEVVGQYCYQAIHGRDKPVEGCPHRRMMADTREHTAEIQEGKLKGLFLETVSPLRDQDGRLTGSVLVARDITKRKQAEEKLRESEEKYRNLVERAYEGIYILQNFAVKYVNPQFASLVGYSADDIVGDSFERLLAPEERQKMKDHFDRRMGGKNAPDRFETRLLHRDGRIIEVEINAGIITYERQPAVLSFVRDIRERKFVEAERIKLSNLESLGTLAGGIAHDFNNLLTAILGNINLARMYVPHNSKAIEKLNKSENAISRAKELTCQLLTFSKGGAPIKKRSQVGDLLRDTVSFHLSGSTIKCEFKLPEDLWLTECDSDQLGLVIGNLVVNGLEAMPRGGSMEVRAENMVVEADESPPLRSGKYIKISIKDSGQGISEENLNKIFDPYFSTKDRVSARGLGLGLSIAHSIIKRHEGHITVESETGVGTIFHVYLPAIDEKTTSEEQELDLTGAGGGRLLIMDDDETLLEVAGEILKHLGYETALVRNGQEAVKKYKESMEAGNPFDAVILDLTIPGGMGGKEAITKLREIDPEVKALVSSGYSNDLVMSSPEHYGFSDVIAKPYKIEKMAKVLQRVLGSKSS